MAERDRVEKVEMVVPAGMSEDFYDAALEAGWSDDPGTGKAILITDRSHPNYGAEILNPTPLAPPAGFQPEESLEAMIARHNQRIANLNDIPIEETEEESEDFDIDDELPDLRSIYEVKEMVEQVPAVGDVLFTEDEYKASLRPDPVKYTRAQWEEYYRVEEALGRNKKPAVEPPVVKEE